MYVWSGIQHRFLTHPCPSVSKPQTWRIQLSIIELKWTIPQNHNVQTFKKIRSKVLKLLKIGEVRAKERYLLKSCNCCCLVIKLFLLPKIPCTMALKIFLK